MDHGLNPTYNLPLTLIPYCYEVTEVVGCMEKVTTNLAFIFIECLPTLILSLVLFPFTLCFFGSPFPFLFILFLSLWFLGSLCGEGNPEPMFAT